MRFVSETIDDLLVAAAATADRAADGQDDEGSDLLDLLRTYYQHADAEDLLAQRPEDLAGAALTHQRLAERRASKGADDEPFPAAPVVRVFTPNVEVDGWSIGHTVVQVVSDDMPFLVDSVVGGIVAKGRRVLRVLHPMVDGARRRESWIHVEIPRETDAEQAEEIRGMLLEVLADVAAAVTDHAAMVTAAREAATRLRKDTILEPEDAKEAADLLDWLTEDHFTFIGYREHTLDRRSHHEVLVKKPETGLGIMRPERAAARAETSAGGTEPLPDVAPIAATGKPLSETASAIAHEHRALLLTKSNARSTVHRDAYLDYIGVRLLDEAGEVAGEQRFLGLFAASAYYGSVLDIPVLRRKVAAVQQTSGYEPGSHAHAALQRVLETFPRDELFQISQEQLTHIATSLVTVQSQRHVRLFVRPDDFGRFLSCLLYLPRDQYDTRVRLRLQHILVRSTGGESIDYEARVGDSPMARLHVVIRMPHGQQLPELDLGLLEKELAQAVRSWDGDLSDALVDRFGEERAAELSRRYVEAFTPGYRERFGARIAAADIDRLEGLQPGSLTCLLYQRPGAAPNHRRLKLFRLGEPMSLTQMLPLLHHLGVTVTNEVPYDIVRADGSHAHIYDFGLEYAWSTDPQDARRFEAAFEAVWRGDVESDGLNGLVLAAGLDHEVVAMLRGYVRYLRQTGGSYSLEYLHEAMVSNPEVVARLVELFYARLDPRDRPEDVGTRQDRAEQVQSRLEQALERVPSLDHDRMLRSVGRVISATLRTNYFRCLPGTQRGALAVKIRSGELPGLPAPRPWAEIWVSGPTVEGVHLRLGPVARGGLRWSDRREDFRVEILDLVKAQAVKNSVIVPVGAKGGFVLKATPRPDAGRQEMLEAGLAAYRTFIGAMLDVTDTVDPSNDAAPVHPPHVVCWDEADPYLVVAADKGTATFSDVANEIATQRDFWLGDAFASGGSTGYDHKAMGITARGAWESVKRHFRDLDTDCQTEPFTCVGIGDMSGDVFGNAMLLSAQTRLVAAFDHRHVFLDPDPDPATSYRERRRLFDLPRASWADYDEDAVSAGGGVFSRRLKRIPVSPQVREALGISGEPSELAPDELIRAILSSPVDLLFNGGVGTFVKASTERHVDAADKTNDRIRVDASQLRCTIVAEGGNLGLTQAARVEFARAGGHVNTDAVDNSAGVNTSDHEVNIKILLAGALRDGSITPRQRNALLSSMTDEVADLVLADNYRHNVALQLALAQASDFAYVHDDYVESLAARGQIDREIEGLPTLKEMRERRIHGQGLTGPEIAVVSAYAKNLLGEDLIDSTLPDHPGLEPLLTDYFPVALRHDFAEHLHRHPLRRQIIATRLANIVVAEAGSTFIHRVGMETGAGPVALCGAHLVASAVFGAREIIDSIDALDNRVPAATQTDMRLRVRTLVERATRWFVTDDTWHSALDEIDDYAASVAEVLGDLANLLPSVEHEAVTLRTGALVEEGVPPECARQVATAPIAHQALGIAATARASSVPVATVAAVHFDIAHRVGLGELQARVVALPRQDRWQTMARATLRDDLYRLHAELTAAVVEEHEEPTDAAAWEATHSDVVTAARSLVLEVVEEEQVDLARASVGLRAVRDLLRRAARSSL